MLPARLLLIPLSVLVATWPGRVAAQEAPPIHHCVDAQGNAVFTDRNCAALQATPVTSATPAPGHHDFSQPPPVLCASSDAALKQAVISAFANHDANRLAGLILWGGDGHRAAVAEIRSLSRWVQQPLLDVSLTGAGTSSPPTRPGTAGTPDPFGAPLSHVLSSPGGTGSASPALRVSTAAIEGGSGAQQATFGIVHRAGCVWLHNDD